MKASRVFASFTLLATLITGCSQDSGTKYVAVPAANMPAFKDVESAPAVIQTAARAVVKINTAGQSATGSFISPTGLLLTNNHVLGNSVSPIEGCYVQITFMSQLGQSPQQPMIAFAKPVAVDVGLDLAVAQLYVSPNGQKLNTPNYLTFNSQEAASLVGQHVTVVGHPEGYLKKWSDGIVSSALGDWIEASAYILPGDSGSPMLDDAGHIVGLIHRGPTSEDLFTTGGANMYSVGSASAPIMSAMSAPLPNTMTSVATPTTADDFVANDYVYLNARSSSVNVGGTSTTPLSLLGTACDAALARTDFKSPDDLQAALAPCYHAQTWIECRSGVSAVPYGTVCPNTSDATAWTNRYQKINQLWQAMNGKIDYYSVSFAMARLQPNISAGENAGAQALRAATNSNPPLDFTLAYYLTAFGIGSYNGTDLRSYILNYQNVPEYELEGSYIVSAATWLDYYGAVSFSDLLSLQLRMSLDSNLSLGTKLYNEQVRYMEKAI